MIGAALLGAAMIAGPLHAELETPDSIAFHVYRDARPMGHHTVSFRRDGEDLHVEIDILLEVQIAFITVFRYQHNNHEVWRDGRLVAIDTWTDDDGKDFWLRGRAVEGGLQVEGSSGSFLAPADIMPTSYWNIETVTRNEMLDTQKGRLISVDVAPAGSEAVKLPGGPADASRYKVTGDLALDLWYTEDGEWAKTAFNVRGSDFAYARKENAAKLAESEDAEDKP